MKVLGKIVMKIFKPVAVLKYLFVPWIVVQSHGTQQFNKMPPTKKYVVQPKTATPTTQISH